MSITTDSLCTIARNAGLNVGPSGNKGYMLVWPGQMTAAERTANRKPRMYVQITKGKTPKVDCSAFGAESIGTAGTSSPPNGKVQSRVVLEGPYAEFNFAAACEALKSL